MNKEVLKNSLETISTNEHGFKVRVIIREGRKDYQEATKEFVARVLKERKK